MYSKISRDKVRNDDIRTNIGITSKKKDVKKLPIIIWSCATETINTPVR